MARKQTGTRKQLMVAINNKCMHLITRAVEDGADVNNVIESSGCMWCYTSPLRAAVSSLYVNGVVFLLDHGATVDNHMEMWVDAISNPHSTEIFRRLFAKLKQQMHTQDPQLEDRDLLARVWGYLERGGDNHGHLRLSIAIEGTPAMMAMSLDHAMPVGTHVRSDPASVRVVQPVIPPGELPLMHGRYIYTPAPLVYEFLTHMNGVADRPHLNTPAMKSTAVEEKTRMLLASGARKFPVPLGHVSLLNLAIALNGSAQGDLVQICLDDRHCENVNHEEYAMQSGHGAITAHPAQQTTPLAHLITKLYPRGVTYIDSFKHICNMLMYEGVDFMQMSDGRTPLLLAVEACQYDKRKFVTQQCVKNVAYILGHITPEQIRMPMSHASHSLITEACSMKILIERTLQLLPNLVRKGVDINTPHGPSGETPIYTIVNRSLSNHSIESIANCQSIVTFLLGNGADIQTPNADGETVIDLIANNIGLWSMGAVIYRQFETRCNVFTTRRREAVGHGLHRRLGASSRLQQVPSELLQYCLSSDNIPPMIPPDKEVFDECGQLRSVN
ncbi:hypothetical protein T484DRAFT_1754855 [Baffinella frigidus]|nr:hypothetical protein T484DRAFT_1754855 [Cryptophyta sp. CCMP2293]